MIKPLSDQIRAAYASDTPLTIQGGGSKAFYGNGAQGVLLDTRVLQGVVEYQPKELVLTARAGTSLHDIELLLAKHRQGLAFCDCDSFEFTGLVALRRSGRTGAQGADNGAPVLFCL